MSFINRAYANCDGALQRRTGTDLRLLYGFGVPIVVTALLVSLGIAFAAITVTVVALMMIEAVMLVTVAIGFTRMLSDSGDIADHGD
jgi:cobalamin biosynthesis protein CobD/CbiB